MSEQVPKIWNRNFILLWQGQLLSLLGVQATQVAVAFWTKHETGSATLMGTLMMVAALPPLFLEPIGGVFADRFNRKRIFVTCDFVSGILMTCLAAFMFVYAGRTHLILVALFIVTGLVGALQAFFRPAITASIPDVVPAESLAAANSLNQSSFELAILLGAGVGGILFRILGAPVLILFDGISYLVSSFSASFVTLPTTVKSTQAKSNGLVASVWSDLSEGFGYFWSQKGMRAFFFMFAVHSFFFVPCLVMLPFYVEDYLGLSSDWYGYLLAAHGVGALLGYLFAGTVMLKGKARATALLGAYLVSSCLIGSLGISHHVLLSMMIVAFVGVFNGVIYVSFVTVVQEHTPAHLRGRLFGIVAMVGTGLQPISMGLTGIVADLLHRDVALIFRGCGFFLSLVVVLFAMLKPLREFLSGSDRVSVPMAGVEGA